MGRTGKLFDDEHKKINKISVNNYVATESSVTTFTDAEAVACSLENPETCEACE